MWKPACLSVPSKAPQPSKAITPFQRSFRQDQTPDTMSRAQAPLLTSDRIKSTHIARYWSA